MSIPDEIAWKLENKQPLTDKEISAAAKIIRAFGQHYYAETGSMFICSTSGYKEGELPDMVMICPAYGSDFRATEAYVRKKP